MPRRNLYDIVTGTPFDVKKESARISQLFCSWADSRDQLSFLVDGMMPTFPDEFRGRALSLQDFNETYNLNFCENYQAETVEDLVTYCEYVISLCDLMEEDEANPMGYTEELVLETLRKTIFACMEVLNLTAIKKGCFTIFVDKDPNALMVSELVKPDLASVVLEYNNRRLKGNIGQKRLLLKLLADDFESNRPKLRTINGSGESELGQLFNKFIRHDQSGTPYIATLPDDQLEDIYDDIYQMYLFSKILLDNLDRKKRAIRLLTTLNGTKS